MPTAITDTYGLGERIRRLRVERGMRQSELAEKARVGRNTIGRIEGGGRGIDSTYGRIAAALDIPLTQLLGEEE